MSTSIQTHTAPDVAPPEGSATRRWRIWIDRRPPPELTVADDLEFTDDLACADGAVVGADETWDAEACRRLPLLKVVARAGIGYDNVDVAGCASEGVAACNAPDAPTVSTAEHTLALLLAVSKRIKRSARQLRAGAGDYRPTHRAMELDGRTLGLLGCGRIGSRVGRYGAALGMSVVVHDPYADASAVAAVGEPVALDELWRRSDVLSLHAPATEATRCIVDAVALAAMPPGVVIVNCARGSLIDHDALLAALESGHVAGAGLDVTEPEPLPVGHRLLARDDVIVTPHVASSTVAGTLRLLEQALEQAAQWLRGGTPEHLLDPAAAEVAVDRRRAAATVRTPR